MNQLINDLINSIIKTDSGNVYFRKGVVKFYDLDTFIQILIDLHLRATKQKPIFEDLEDFSDYDARTMYSIANANLVFYSSYFSNEDKETLLVKILNVAYERKSFEALESVYLTLSIDMGYFDELKSDYFLMKFMVIGFAKNLGGGFINSYILDIKNDIILAFNKDSEFLLKKALLTNKLSTNFLDRLSEKNNQIKLDASTSIGTAVMAGALWGASVGTMLSPGPGTAIGAAAGATTGLVIGVTNWHNDVVKEYENNNNPQKDTENKSANETGQKDGEETNDTVDKPKPPEDECKADNSCSTENNTEGCIIDPNKADFSKDPYSKFSKNTQLMTIPYGEGLKSFGNEISSNQFKLSGRPKFEWEKNGILSITKLGFWGYSKEYKTFIESNIAKQKAYLNLITNSIESKMSDFEVKYESNFESTNENSTNENTNEESKTTIIFTNPPIGEITLPSEDMIKFINTLEFILRKKKKDIDFGQEKKTQFELEKLKNLLTKDIIR